jgi:RNA polymerase sigma factor (TIGR02999 family)
MSEATQILNAIEQGDPKAAEKLLPLVYDELRKLAAQKLACEQPGQTLQPTALVHEAYLRLVGERDVRWNSRGHFIAAAAEAMRRILVDIARGKQSLKRGAGRLRVPLDEASLAQPRADQDILAVSEALDLLAAADAEAAQLVKLRFFAGLTAEQAASAMGVSPRTADRLWVYARSYLLKAMDDAAK